MLCTSTPGNPGSARLCLECQSLAAPSHLRLPSLSHQSLLYPGRADSWVKLVPVTPKGTKAGGDGPSQFFKALIQAVTLDLLSWDPGNILGAPPTAI